MTDLPDTSPNLGLPFYQTKLNEFEVQHNEALLMLDALVMLAVKDRDLGAPPSSPALGDRYLVKAAGTGNFAGKDNRVAQYDTGGWNFYAPQEGWTCYVQDEQVLIAWDGTAWQPALDVLGAITDIENLSLLGIGTTADSTNPLSAKLNNVLWTAKTVAEGGDGTLRYKLSKESASKTLSFLFQDNFSGRAEFGLTGDDDFHVKVSADGSTWLEAIQIDHATGVVTFPHNPSSSVPADLDITLAELALGLADALNVAGFLGSAGNRVADSFDALTYVNTGGATNLDTGTAGLLKPTATGVGARFAAATPSMPQGGTAANINDNSSGTTATTPALGNFGGQPVSARIVAQLDLGSVQSIAKVEMINASVPGTDTAWGFYTSTDGSTWTAYGTAFTGSSTPSSPSRTGVASARYVAFAVGAINYGLAVSLADLNVYALAANNMTVTSTALTATSAPTQAKLVARVKEIDSITLNTDLIFCVSRDGGTTWSAFSMADRFTTSAIHVLESAPLDISGQPSGTSVKWKATTANNKSVELHDIYLYWS